MRTKLLAVLLCFGASTVTQAALESGAGDGSSQAVTPFAAESDVLGTRLRDGLDKLLGFISSSETPTLEEITTFLDGEIAPFFDFDYMAQVAAGRLYQAMSDEQRERMATNIRRQFLGTLAARLSGYQDQGVRFLNARVNNDGRTGAASIALMNPRGYPARINFRFYKNSDEWRVFDVVANGQSAVAHYRRQFRRMMREPAMRPSPGVRYGVPRYR